MDIIKEDLIGNSEAKEILSRRSKEVELGYEQKNALEHLKKYTKLNTKKFQNLMKELKKIERLREREIILICNLLPMDKDDLKVILHKDYTNFTEDEIKLILETVKKFI